MIIAGRDTRAPDATDQIWLACTAGAVWRAEADWRWAIDAVWVIRGGMIDWSRLAETSRQCQTTCQVRAALSFLATVLPAPVPPAVLELMQSAAVSPVEAGIFDLTSRRYGRLGAMRRHWLQYYLQTNGRPSRLGFLRYLEAEWALGSRRQAMLAACKRGWMGIEPAG
jgi:hypothetical protein